MIFFFERGGAYLRCDIHTDDSGAGYELVVVAPDGSETVESFDTADRVFERWQSLQTSLKAEGWWGPHGRTI